MSILLGCVLSIALAGLPSRTDAQITDQPTSSIDSLERGLRDAREELARTRTILRELHLRMLSLETRTRNNAYRVDQADSALKDLHSGTSQLKNRTDSIGTALSANNEVMDGRVAALDQRTGQHWMMTLVMVALVLGLLGLAFWGLKRLLGRQVGAVDAELGRINVDMQTKMMKLDTDLLGSLEKLVSTKTAPHASTPATEGDHGLALKVADEITRIEQNLTQMDSTVKGHKQLIAAVKRMHENLQAAGYRLPELLGKAFDEGMKLLPSFISDDTLQENERIITRVFKPTVLFQGKMIQSGEVQVSQG